MLTLIPLTRTKKMTIEQQNRFQELVQLMFAIQEPMVIDQK